MCSSDLASSPLRPRTVVLHDTVPQLTDTVRLRDTTYVPLPVAIRVMAAADTALHACHAVLDDCQAQQLLLSAQVQTWQRKYNLAEASHPSALAPWIDRAEGAGFTLALQQLLQLIHR